MLFIHHLESLGQAVIKSKIIQVLKRSIIAAAKQNHFEEDNEDNCELQEGPAAQRLHRH